jgi:hypothetical protein
MRITSLLRSCHTHAPRVVWKIVRGLYFHHQNKFLTGQANCTYWRGFATGSASGPSFNLTYPPA